MYIYSAAVPTQHNVRVLTATYMQTLMNSSHKCTHTHVNTQSFVPINKIVSRQVKTKQTYHSSLTAGY
jgi:hypothetical protein